MTTIAFDSLTGVVAADSQETGDSGQKYSCQKLFVSRGRIIATAGGTYAGMAFVGWFDGFEEDGETDWDARPDYINLDNEEDFECLVIRPDGTCYTVNRLFVPVEQTGNRFITLGSGGAAARGAMMAGADPEEAVTIACEIDSYTGGAVKVMRVGRR